MGRLSLGAMIAALGTPFGAEWPDLAGSEADWQNLTPCVATQVPSYPQRSSKNADNLHHFPVEFGGILFSSVHVRFLVA